jgi:soluble lytic murein transglycosylase-like protein
VEESLEAPLIVADAYYPDAVARAIAAADRSSEPVQGALEATLAMAEVDPEGARLALWRLQADWETLALMEAGLGGEPTQAALRIGATIQLARAELASPTPQLDRLRLELMEWLGRRQLNPAE